MKCRLFLFVAIAYLFFVSQPLRAATASSLTKDGIIWTFDKAYEYGQFVNGDYYVIGPVTIVSITPLPANGRNGSVLNLPLDSGISGFDNRVSSNRFREYLRKYPPFSINPGDALISSISLNNIGDLPAWLREGEEQPSSPVRSVSILTCVTEVQPPDAFRPSYCDRGQKIFRAGQILWDRLLRLPKVAETPDINLFAEHFRRPWLDVCFFGFDAATEYQACYGRETGRATGMAVLLLQLDFSNDQKRNLLINFIQYGIDLWGIARAGYSGWPAHGGHGSGRKLPIIFSGLLLGDNEMACPNASFPELKFGEDMHTMYANSWTGAKVVYAGHQGVWNGTPVSQTPGWGPYEHLPPTQWFDNLGENYRRCCTSLCWVGQALAMRLLQAGENWNHPAFFDYADRWMSEDDTEQVRIIRETRGWDYSAHWARQRQCWDHFVENMWAAYRQGIARHYSLIIGWNWISFSTLPIDTSLNSVFSGILGQVEQIKTQTQSAIRSTGNWKGDLANMNGINQSKMYKVKVNAACTLTVAGTAALSATPIHLTGGWNWMAYLPASAMPIATALASINGQVQEVKSLTQSATYSGGAWSGTLSTMQPGQGYAIKMSGPGTLTYPAAAQVGKIKEIK